MAANNKKKRKPIVTNGNGGLTYKQNRFVEEYLVDGHPAKAAKRAGYNSYAIFKDAENLMKHPKVKQAITKRQAELRSQVQVHQEDVLREYMKIAFFDEGNLYQSDGRPYAAVTDVPVDVRTAMQSLRVSTVKGNGNGGMQTVIKGTPYNKLQALDALSRYLGLFEKDNERRLDINITELVAVLGLSPEQISELKLKMLARMNAPALQEGRSRQQWNRQQQQG